MRTDINTPESSVPLSDSLLNLLNERAFYVTIDKSGKIETVGVQFLARCKYENEELVGRHLSDFFDVTNSYNNFSSAIDFGAEIESWKGQITIACKTGEKLLLDATITPIISNGALASGFLIIGFEKIEQRSTQQCDNNSAKNESKTSEELTVTVDQKALLRAAKDLLLRNRLNECLIKAESPVEVMNGICETLVEVGGYNMCWIGVVDEVTKRFEPKAIFGDSYGYVRNLNVSVVAAAQNDNIIAQALLENKVKVVQDFGKDSSRPPWKHLREMTGFSSKMVVPMYINKQERMALLVYTDKANYFDDFEIETLTSISENIKAVIERFRLAEKLSEKEANITAIINNTQDIILSIDCNFRLIEFNEVYYSMIQSGYGRQPKVGDSVLEYVEDKLRHEYENTYRKVLNGEHLIERQVYEHQRSGYSSTFEISYHPIKNEEEQIIGITIFSRNITDRLIVESDLINSRNQLTAILDSSNEIHFFLDPDLKIVSFNKSAEAAVKAIFNRVLEPGQDVLQYSAIGQAPLFVPLFNRALAGESIRTEKEVTYPNGTTLWLDIRLFPVYNNHSKVIGVSFNKQDI